MPVLRAAARRTLALAALLLVITRQVPAVTVAGVLEDPAWRDFAAEGAAPERVTVLAAFERPAAGEIALAVLKGEAAAVARRVAARLGVDDWRLGNRVEEAGRVVYLDGRTRGGATVRVAAWHGDGRRGTAVVLVQSKGAAGLAAVRRDLARALAAALGVPPHTVDTAVEVRGFVAGHGRVVTGAAVAGPPKLDVLGEVVW